MCDCKVGPGKFESEGVLTFLAYQSSMLGCADVTTGAEDQLTDWFRSPFGFEADSEVLVAARGYGYCEACIQEALESEAYGIAISERSNGFVDGWVFTSRQDFDAALDRAEHEDYLTEQEAREIGQ